MDMGINQAWEDTTPLKIDNPRALSDERTSIRVGANIDEMIARHR
jgi:hypothetical protein